MGKARTTEEILELAGDSGILTDYYHKFHDQCREEDTYYNLDFDVPEVEGFEPHRPSTARQGIDDAASQVDTTSLRVEVRPRNSSGKAAQNAEVLRRGDLGFWHRVFATRGMILHRLAKHDFLYGIGWMKIVYDADLWTNRPRQKEGEDIVAFAERIADWRERRSLKFPFVVSLVHPTNILPDPSSSGCRYIIEKSKKRPIDLIDRWPEWGEHISSSRLLEPVDWIEYWDDEYVAYVCDALTVMPARKHNYGAISYVSSDAGFGYEDAELKPEKRWRGILNCVHDDLRLEARLISQLEAILRTSAWTSRIFSGPNRKEAEEVMENWGYGPGENNYLPEGMTVDWEKPSQIPNEVLGLLGLTGSTLARALVPRIAMGERAEGVASGYMTAILASLARVKFGPVLFNMCRSVEGVSALFRMIIENAIQDDVTVWGKTPAGLFDQTIGPRDINGYYDSYATLRSVAPEEEERMGMYGAKLHQQGLISHKLWQLDFGHIDQPSEDFQQIQIERIFNSPPVQEYIAHVLMQTQMMEEEIERAAGGQMGGLGNQGIPPGVFPRPNERERGMAVRTPVLPGGPEELDLVGRQMRGEGTPTTRKLWPK